MTETILWISKPAPPPLVLHHSFPNEYCVLLCLLTSNGFWVIMKQGQAETSPSPRCTVLLHFTTRLVRLGFNKYRVSTNTNQPVSKVLLLCYDPSCWVEWSFNKCTDHLKTQISQPTRSTLFQSVLLGLNGVLRSTEQWRSPASPWCGPQNILALTSSVFPPAASNLVALKRGERRKTHLQRGSEFTSNYLCGLEPNGDFFFYLLALSLAFVFTPLRVSFVWI